MDDPSAQLSQEIRNTVVRALATRRPILHHLNADTSWLLQIPRPASAVARGGRIYYSVLIDPWFTGAQSDGAKWFSQQWHATKSAVASVAEVEELARQVELLAGGLRPGTGRTREALKEDSFVDVVVVSHEFTDHCHRETLIEVHADVPVVATEAAAKLIASWGHFRTVVTTPTFTDGADWHDYSLLPLPSWLSITRLTAGDDLLYYHSALLVAFATRPFASRNTPKKRSSLSIDGDDGTSFSNFHSENAECVIYTPHGIHFEALAPIAAADPPLRTLAFMHGLHDVSISAAQQLNLGAKNGVMAQKMLKAKYWVGTHDEVKKGSGFVSWFLRRKKWTLEEALKEVRTQLLLADGDDEDMDSRSDDELDNIRFQELSNGESRILE